MNESSPPLEGGPPVPAPPGAGGAGRNIAWILVVAVLLFGAAYFLVDLRPAGPDVEAEAEPGAAGSGDPGSAPLDTVITAADLPGFEAADLTNAQRLWLYHRAHQEICACECGMTVAECRVEDATCPESPGRAKELVDEAREAVPGGS